MVALGGLRPAGERGQTADRGWRRARLAAAARGAHGPDGPWQRRVSRTVPGQGRSSASLHVYDIRAGRGETGCGAFIERRDGDFDRAGPSAREGSVRRALRTLQVK